MKVLHINTIDSGGAAIAAKRLHLLLLKNGVDSKILFLKRSGNTEIKEAYYFEDLFSSFGFKVIEKANTFYNRRYTFSDPEVYFNGPDSLFNLSKHPLFKWADVIHLHWVVKFIDWAKVFSNKEKKFIWTLHDMNPFTGGEHYRTGYKGEFKNIGIKNIEKKIKCLEHTNLSILTPSQWLGDLSSQSEVFKDKPHFTIRNPIDTSIFKPMNKLAMKQKHGLDEQKKTLMFVAENPQDERKGLSILNDALSNLAPESYKLAIIGNPSHVKKIHPEAHFTGSIHDENILAEMYNAADAFVIPSLEDNLPNTVSEALLCGTAVCGLKIGGIKEMVKEGENGFLAEQTSELSKHIQNTLDANFDNIEIRNLALKSLDENLLYIEFMSVYQND